jgi:hypothetical protein
MIENESIVARTTPSSPARAAINPGQPGLLFALDSPVAYHHYLFTGYQQFSE